MSRKFFYVPENFYPERFLPDSLSKYGDDARYFVHKIYEQRVLNSRAKEDFIPLKAGYLRKVMSERKYSEIRSSLLNAGAIESDNWYVRGEKATGYRLGPVHRGVKHKKVEIACRRLIRNLEKEAVQHREEIELDVHRHLHNLLQRIEIDYDGALLSLDDDDFTSNHIAVEMIRDKEWFFHPDTFGRVHTNITNLKSSLRQWLRVDGLSLTELDIANSQPFFFGVLLKTYLLNNGNLISWNSLPPLFPSLPCDIFPADAKKYLDLVAGGSLYEYLSEQFQISLENRRKFKTKLFAEVFFCKNGWKSKNAELFAREFPTVYAIVRRLKAKDYTALSKQLQKVESSFMLNKVVRRLMEIDPNLFVATIHDSLLVKPKDADLAQQVISEVFRPWGLLPTIKASYLA